MCYRRAQLVHPDCQGQLDRPVHREWRVIMECLASRFVPRLLIFHGFSFFSTFQENFKIYFLFNSNFEKSGSAGPKRRRWTSGAERWFWNSGHCPFRGTKRRRHRFLRCYGNISSFHPSHIVSCTARASFLRKLKLFKNRNYFCHL